MITFEGKAVFTLSKTPPKEFIDNLEKIISDINEGVLKKGAKRPQDAAKILNVFMKDNMLIMEILGGERVRLHHATLRIKNYLAPILGKKYKIGVRGIKVIDGKIIIDGIYKFSKLLPFVRDINIQDKKTILILEELSESELKKPIIDRLLKLIEYKELREKFGGKVEHWKLIKKSKEKKIYFTEDPNEVLEKIGWIKRFSVGQWLYTPPITYLIRKFEELFIKNVVKPLNFEEAIYPKIVPVELGLKTGHIKGTVNQMIFASQPKSYDIKEFEDFIDLVMVLDEVPKDVLLRHLKPPSHWLCFAQCEPFYWFFENEIIDPDTLPILWFDRSGPSFRWEAGGIKGLERMVEFHRIEITWLGEPEQVIEIRNKLLERYEYFMDKVLDLEWRWAWVTPFFLVHAGEIEEETEVNINQPGTIDFEAWLPYKGNKDDQHSWLEIGNISIHGTKYSDPLKIKHKKSGKIIWTGCSGFGVERWLIAFLAQKGFNPENWPKEVRKEIKDLPKSIKLVTYPKREGRKLLEEIEKSFSSL